MLWRLRLVELDSEGNDTERRTDLIDEVLDYLEILTALLEGLKEELNAKRITSQDRDKDKGSWEAD